MMDGQTLDQVSNKIKIHAKGCYSKCLDFSYVNYKIQFRFGPLEKVIINSDFFPEKIVISLTFSQLKKP